MSNAQKFCEKGYICVVVRLGKPGQVVFQVRDTGVGIPASFRSALFQPFRQADQSLTRPKQGTGLGLSIVKHLVSRMSGSVDVESVEGEGSTFSVRLPIALTGHPPNSQEEPLLDISNEPPAPQASGKRIRIVHNDPRVEGLFVELFADHGYIPTSGLSEASVQEVMRNTDAVWADVESVASSSLLRSLLCTQTNRPFPVYVVHNDSRDLATLEPELGAARNAILLKRPLLLHSLRDMLENPEPHMGAHIAQQEAPKVRFALPVTAAAVAETVGTLQKEKFRETVVGSTPVEEKAGGEEIEMEPKRKEVVLLVEDNLVRRSCL